uniref:Uncharacterized protein n=1 Tax=Eutreptiella gymnastica TaxID=73025 RepID=A0A7S4GNR4_9EUGL
MTTAPQNVLLLKDLKELKDLNIACFELYTSVRTAVMTTTSPSAPDPNWGEELRKCHRKFADACDKMYYHLECNKNLKVVESEEKYAGQDLVLQNHLDDCMPTDIGAP